MLKHKAKKPNSEPKAPKVEGAIVSDSFTKNTLFTKKRLIVFGGAALVLLIIIGTLVLLGRRDDNKNEVEEPSYTVTDQQYAEQYATALENKLRPPEGASEREIAIYYSELITTYFTAKNYQATVNTYNKYIQESSDKDFLFSGYNATANAYIQLGNKPEAAKVIARAEIAIQRTVSDKELLSDYMALLDSLKKEVN